MKTQIALAGGLVAAFLTVAVGPSLNTTCLDQAGSAAYYDARIDYWQSKHDRFPDHELYQVLLNVAQSEGRNFELTGKPVCTRYIPWFLGTDRP
jgi:hypothetical protein